MVQKLSVLILEDNEDDAALFELELKRGDYEATVALVEGRQDYVAALDDGRWDLIVADYRLPGFTGLEALQLLKKLDLDIPFILVSGTIDAETAIGALKAGAHDYIQKGDLTRFLPAVERELREARLRRGERERAAFASVLAILRNTIHSTLNVNEIIEKAVKIGLPALRAEGAAVAVREGDTWAIRHARGALGDFEGNRLAGRELPISALAALRGDVVSIEDVPGDERSNMELVERYGILSLLAVPLTVGSEIAGVISFTYHTTRQQFSDSQITFTHDLGNQISLALTNARLYEQEHKVADTLRSLLARNVPCLPGLAVSVSYRPARATENVGGDFYDVFEVGEDEVVVLVGDVSGKGLEAAALTETIRSSVRTLSYAHSSPSPAFIFNQLDTSLRQQLRPGEFATALLLFLNTATGRVRLVTAGHPPPVICGPRTCVIQQPPVGLPLGVLPSNYEESYLELSKGDTLVLYTDGVTEARLEGDLYGEERLLEALARLHNGDIASLSDRLLESAVEYAGGQLTDDAVIVAVRLIQAS